MDFLYGHDRKFSDFEDPDMTDMLGPDMFATSSMVSTLMTKPQQPTLPYVRSWWDFESSAKPHAFSTCHLINVVVFQVICNVAMLNGYFYVLFSKYFVIFTFRPVVTWAQRDGERPCVYKSSRTHGWFSKSTLNVTPLHAACENCFNGYYSGSKGKMGNARAVALAVTACLNLNKRGVWVMTAGFNPKQMQCNHMEGRLKAVLRRRPALWNHMESYYQSFRWRDFCMNRNSTGLPMEWHDLRE